MLLCTQCGYCVLNRALDRHLKAIHHLPASERKQHIADTSDQDIADLEDVVYPAEGSEQVPGLPVFDGYKCGVEGCRYLCVTNKRMQAHWRSAHDGEDDVYCLRVRLQTFFRGNSLRYFVVANRSSGTRSDQSNKFDSDDSGSSATLDDTPTKHSQLDAANAGIQGCNEVSKKVNQVSKRKAKIVEFTPAIDLTPPADGIETAIEWLLTRQFCDDNYVSLQPVKGSTLSWRDEILQACSEADFLRFAILSLSANYIAMSYPDSRESFGIEAARYRDLAMKALGKTVKEVNNDNFFAVFNFTRLITLCCLAGIQLNKLEAAADDTAPTSVLPEWFPIQHQGKALVWPYRGSGRIIRAMHGPWESLTLSNAMPEYDLSNNPYDERLHELEIALKFITDTTVDPSCVDALNILRRVWTTPYRDEGNAFRDMALMWPTRVPAVYLELVESGDPVALIIMAHYWVLWSLSEAHYWYMKGHAETMLLRIVQKLDPQWQSWIEWPIEMVFGGDLDANADQSSTVIPRVQGDSGNSLVNEVSTPVAE